MSDTSKRWTTILGVIATAIGVTVGPSLLETQPQPPQTVDASIFDRIETEISTRNEAIVKLDECVTKMALCKQELDEAQKIANYATAEIKRTVQDLIIALGMQPPEKKPVLPVFEPEPILSNQVTQWLVEMSATIGEAEAMRRAFNTVLVGMQTGMLVNAQAIKTAQKAAMLTTVRMNSPKWAAIKQHLRTTLNGIRDQSGLETVDQHMEVWTDIIAGINFYIER